MTAPLASNPGPVRPRPPAVVESRAHRLVRKTLIVLAIVAVLIIAGIQVVLWTNAPRRIVLGIIQEQLGLRVTAKSLSTGWLGHTSLHDVTIALPLADKPFLELPELDVRHTWLPGLLLNRPMAVFSLDLTRPRLVVRQSPGGRWNVQEAIDLAAGALASSASNSTATTLPEIHVHEASLSVTDNQDRQLVIDPLQVDCKADSAVSWKFHVKAQDRVDLSGRVAPAAQWQHSLTIAAQNISDWVRPWAPKFPADAVVRLQWSGQVASKGLIGNLSIDKLAAGDMNATGQVGATIKQTSPALLIEPKNLVLATGHTQIGSLRFLSGAITSDGHTLSTDSLDVAAFGGPINVKGWIDPVNQLGELHAAWRQLALPGNITHDGSASIRLSRPFVTQLVAAVKVNSTGRTPRGSWNADLSVDAQGADWFNLDWRLEAPTLQWITLRQTTKLDGLFARGQLHKPKGAAAPQLSMEALSSPGDLQMSGQGDYNFADRSWKLHLGGAKWPLHPIEDVEFGYIIDADGDGQNARLQKMALTSGALKLMATGTYRYGRPRPVLASISLNNPGEEQSAASTAIVSGQLAGDAGLEGTLLPLQLSMSGRLAGTDVAFGPRPLGDINLVFDGAIDADKIDARTKTLRFLGGDWDLHVQHSLVTDESDVDVKVRNLALADVGDMLGTRPMGGRLSGEWDLQAPTLRLDLSKIKLSGSGIASGGVGFGAALEVDQARFSTNFDNGQLHIAPIQFERGDYGRGNAQLSWSRTDPRHIEATCTLAAWPIDAPDQELAGHVWLGLNRMAVDLPDPKNADPAKHLARFNAPQIDIRVSANHDEEPLGEIHILAASTDRSVDFKQVQGTLLGGNIEGSGHFDLDQPQTSLANLVWSHLDSRRIVQFLPETEGLTGEMNGAAVLTAARTSRALAPMQFSVHNTWKDGAFRKLRLVDATINGYADFALEREARGERSLRIVLDDSRQGLSLIHLGEGNLNLWGRLSRHVDNSLAVQGQVTFQKLDLDEVLHTADPSVSSTPGKIAGNVMILFDTSDTPKLTKFVPMTETPATLPTSRPTTMAGAHAAANSATEPSTQPAPASLSFRHILDRVYCEGNAQLSDANLANIGFISLIYNALNVFQKANQPTGTGTVDFRVERSVLLIPAMRYFNRGTEVRAQLKFPEVWTMPYCKVEGTAVGVARPLAQIKLPFLEDVESAFSSLQSDLLTSVSISGTVIEPKYSPLLFKNLGSDFHRFFKSDVDQAKQQTESQ